MQGTDLKPKKTRAFFKIFYALVLLIVVFALIFYLYGYLWEKFSVAITKQLTKGVYLESTAVACSSTVDCSSACDGFDSFGLNEACMCLKGYCRYVANTREFVERKFCETDSDCTISCYEGPVSQEYYASVGGTQNDCSDGCVGEEYTVVNGSPNGVVCRNKQCQYENGRACFIDSIKTP